MAWRRDGEVNMTVKGMLTINEGTIAVKRLNGFPKTTLSHELRNVQMID